MSSRRGAGEENILAMLERDSARRSGTRMTSPRLAWYCAAAAFSGILVGVVAWLAYDNHETATAMQVQVQAERVAEGDAVAPAPEVPQAATIVDQPQSMPAAPPLVMLPAEPAAKAGPPAPAKEAAPSQAGTAPAPASPAAPAKAAAPAAAKPAKSDKPAALAKADKPVKSAPRAVKTQRPATAKGTTPARTRSKAGSPAPAEPAVDTDVALISAIIQHSERHRGERAQAAPCTGPKCPPQPSASTRP